MNALIIVDMQNDFMEGGALAVPGARALIPLINRLQTCFQIVVATQDWHPADHASFVSKHPGKKAYDVINLHGLPQTLWPEHCVQETAGADFVAGLDRRRWTAVVQKGIAPEIDSYSGFFDNGKRRATGMADVLRRHDVHHVWLMGVATDYCVKYTALDAVALGFHVTLVDDACRGVDLKPGDTQRAIEEMQSGGVQIQHAAEVWN